MQIKPKKQKNAHHRVRAFGLIAGFLLTMIVSLLLALEKQVQPVAQTIAEMKSRELCVNVMQKATAELLEAQPQLYQTLFTVNKSESGQLTGAACDPLRLNTLQNKLEAAVSAALSQQQELCVRVPLGTLSGVQLLAGMGPSVKVQAIPLSNVSSEVESRFQEAGINQTLLEADVVVSVEIGTLLAGVQTRQQVQSRVRIAHLMVVGETPQFYVSR